MKKLGILLAIAMLMLVSVVMAGTCTISPASSGTIRGTAVINVTMSAETNATAANCTVAASSALSGDSVTFIVFNNTDSAGTNETNTTLNTLGRKDASDWVFSVTSCVNSTDSVISETCSVTGVTIDNTVPTCAFSSKASKGEYLPTDDWTITSYNATSGTLQFGSNPLYTLTKNAGNTSYSYTNDITIGMYTNVAARMSDGANTTTCSLDYISINPDRNSKQLIAVSEDAKKEAEPQQQPQSNGTSLLTLLAVVGAIVYFKSRKK